MKHGEPRPFAADERTVQLDIWSLAFGEPPTDGAAARLDVGTIVLTGDDACVQTIVNLAAGALEKIEVIRGTRSRGQVRILP